MNIITDIFNSMINYLYQYIGDLGIVIILLTIVVKLLLLPLSIKSKMSMNKYQDIQKRMEDIKKRYKNNKQKLEQEIQKLSIEGSKSMLGCLITFMQLPIMFSLYRVISSIPLEVGSIIVPWISNLKMPDGYFIIPILSAIIQLIPDILAYFNILKQGVYQKPKKLMVIIKIVFNLFIVARLPVIIGIYWIVSGIISVIELFIFSFIHKKNIAQENYS